MAVYISKNILGTKKHIGWNGSEFVSCEKIKDDDWIYDHNNHLNSLTPICYLKSFNLNFPPDNRLKSWQQIPGVSTSAINWSLSLPQSMFKQTVKNSLEQLWLLFKSLKGTYYINEFYVIRDLLLKLSAAKIDASLYKAILSDPEVNKSSLLSFKPNKVGYANVARYSQVKTVTGRLTVGQKTSGILHLLTR